MEIKLNARSATPLYQQIAEQIRQAIAMEQLKPGDRLPSIRQLSRALNINPNTVCRAYLELEQEQILVSRRGGGTSVMSPDRIGNIKAGRQRKLLESMNDDIIKTLSQGYSPEELEARFGRETRLLVQEMSDDKTLDKMERKRLQVEHAPSLSEKAKLIKLADKICNVRDVTHRPPARWPLTRRREYLDWTERVVAGCRGGNAALEAHYDRVLREGRELLGRADVGSSGD